MRNRWPRRWPGAAILCVEVDPSRIERRLETRYLDEVADSLDDGLARVRRPPRPRAARSRSDCSGTLPPCSPSSPHGASTSTSSPTRPRRTTRSPATCPAEVPFEEAEALRARDPDGYVRLARESIVAHVTGDDRVRARGLLRLRLREQPAGGGPRRGPGRRVLVSGVRPGVHPAALLPRDRTVPVGRALGRSGGHRRDRP